MIEQGAVGFHGPYRATRGHAAWPKRTVCLRKKHCEPARAAGKASSFWCQFDLVGRHGGVRMTQAVAKVFLYENQPSVRISQIFWEEWKTMIRKAKGLTTENEGSKPPRLLIDFKSAEVGSRFFSLGFTTSTRNWNLRHPGLACA